MKPLRFSIEKKDPDSLLRAGVIETPHGVIHTPAFIPVGTKATIKSVLPDALKELGAEAVLSNTYHLYLQPGEGIVKKAGGLNKFMNWSGPTMTDSGGFQVFSLGEGMNKAIGKFAEPEKENKLVPAVFDEDLATSHGKLAVIDEEGVTFTSHLNGSLHRFTAERSIEIQHALGADIIFAFDECTSPYADRTYQKEAMDRTHRWAKRSLDAHKQNVDAALRQGLFGIVQGGRFADLREESARLISEMDFDGYGIGGSFSKEDLFASLRLVNSILPEEKPRHLLGIGEPGDLFVGVEEGVDTFDCVAPTRIGRNGSVYTKDGLMILLNNSFREDFTPIEKDCECYTCKNYTRAYLAHLFRGKEMIGGTLASIHNIYFIVNLMKKIRISIVDGHFPELKGEFMTRYYV